MQTSQDWKSPRGYLREQWEGWRTTSSLQWKLRKSLKMAGYPPLDSKLKVSATNIIMYQFFEKPTNPNTELHQRKAMAEDAKLRSLTNEVIRMMVTTIPEETICQILDRFPQKMANNGYGVLQIRRVILAGIRGDWKGRGRGNSTGLKRKAAT